MGSSMVSHLSGIGGTSGGCGVRVYDGSGGRSEEVYEVFVDILADTRSAEFELIRGLWPLRPMYPV